jgi:hypothetical protein
LYPGVIQALPDDVVLRDNDVAAYQQQRRTTPEGLLLRPAVTLPVEIYSEKRIREFDEAEADLAKALSRRRRLKKPAR